MSAAGRRKGADAEREFRDVLRAHGFQVERDGSRHGDLRDTGLQLGRFHVEVKRQETLRIHDWLRQCDSDAKAQGKVPWLAFRRSRQPWRVVVPADWLLDLLAHTVNLRVLAEGYEPPAPEQGDDHDHGDRHQG